MPIDPVYAPADGDINNATLFRAQVAAILSALNSQDGSTIQRGTISSRSLSDRYSLSYVPFEMSPQTPRQNPPEATAHDSLDPATGYASATERTWEMSNLGTEIEGFSLPIFTAAGAQAWLAAIIVKAKEVVSASSGYPQVRFYRGTQLLGGAARTLNVAETWYGLVNDDPIRNPVCDVTLGQSIRVTHESSVNAAAGSRPRVRGLVGLALLKIEHCR